MTIWQITMTPCHLSFDTYTYILIYDKNARDTMKKLILIVILLFPIKSYAQTFKPIPFNNGTDKQLHCLGTYAMTYTSYKYFEPIYGKEKAFFYSSLLSFSVGVVKEVYDHYDHNGYEADDVIANAAGIILFRFSIEF